MEPEVDNLARTGVDSGVVMLYGYGAGTGEYNIPNNE